jgi:sec-independent protein translocase protein TatA
MLGRSRAMLGLRLPELVIILAVLVLVFGASKIPQLGDALGRGIQNFKKTFEKADSASRVAERSWTEQETEPAGVELAKARRRTADRG